MSVTTKSSFSTMRTGHPLADNLGEKECLHSISQKEATFPHEARELIRNITRHIKRQTNFGVQEMRVFLENDTVILVGYCHTFYTKQLAQEAALKLIGDVPLENRIRVA